MFGINIYIYIYIYVSIYIYIICVLSDSRRGRRLSRGGLVAARPALVMRKRPPLMQTTFLPDSCLGRIQHLIESSTRSKRTSWDKPLAIS